MVLENALHLKNPACVKQAPLSLTHGYPGLVLLFAHLDRVYPEDGFDRVCHDYILKIKETIEKEGVKDLSLFGGLAGCCYAIQQASRDGTRYQKLLTKLNSVVFERKISQNLPCPAEMYDLVSGVIGLGVYALHYLDHFPFVSDALQFCVKLTQKIEWKGHLIPGWYVPHEFQFTDHEKQNYPEGNFDQGLAHGVSGVLAFLSIALLGGAEVKHQREAIEIIAGWLISKKKGETYWTDRISFEEEVGRKPSRDASFLMDAWCYGTAGVARSLYLAGTALQSPSLQKLASDAFLSIFSRDFSLLEKTFCHGIAGLLAITQLMAHDTQIQELKDWSIRLKEKLSFDEENPGLPPGLLSGLSGILLTLLPYEKGRFTWALIE